MAPPAEKQTVSAEMVGKNAPSRIKTSTVCKIHGSGKQGEAATIRYGGGGCQVKAWHATSEMRAGERRMITVGVFWRRGGVAGK